MPHLLRIYPIGFRTSFSSDADRPSARTASVTEQEKENKDSLLRQSGQSALEEGKSTLRWLLIGAGIGASISGVAGGVFLGWTGLSYGAAAGAVIGAFTTLWLVSEI